MTKQMSRLGVDDSASIHWKVLVELTEQLKLSDTKYDKAVERYESIGQWLNDSNDPIFEDAIIYVQGSVRLGTTVKPYKSDEYDIDLVVHLPHAQKYFSSEKVKEIIGARLQDNGRYEAKLSSLKRGWRINYAGDFHLDITPAIPDNECDNMCPINKQYAEFVPDSKLMNWKESNPRGYAHWFHHIDEKIPQLAFDSKDMFALESRTIEDVPDQHNFKGVLKRTVQLLKRHRDIYFNEVNLELKEWAPISIIITTLAAKAYEEIIKSDRSFTAISIVRAIVKNMVKHIVVADEKYSIPNPTNLKENFAEKWNESELYEIAFQRWIKAFKNDIESIFNVEGLDVVGKTINASFGGNYGNRVVESLNTDVKSKREAGLMSSVFALDNETTVAKNTFFGA